MIAFQSVLTYTDTILPVDSDRNFSFFLPRQGPEDKILEGKAYYEYL